MASIALGLLHHLRHNLLRRINFGNRFVGFFVGVFFRSSYGLLIGAETSGFDRWSGVGNWRGFVLGRNWVTDCSIGGLDVRDYKVFFSPSVFLMHSGHFQLERERTILSSYLVRPKYLGWNHSGQN